MHPIKALPSHESSEIRSSRQEAGEGYVVLNRVTHHAGKQVVDFMSTPVRIPPPFDAASAHLKVRLAEDAWNSRDPQRVALAYSLDAEWRNRGEFIHGRDEIERFLSRKWERELEYRLVKELWTYGERRIAVRFQYEWCNQHGQWHRSYGNELWEFDDEGRMRRREASINDLEIRPEERKFFWPAPGPRPVDHAGIEAIR